jgi:hypothetical protein
MWRVAGPDVPGDPAPRVTVEETPSESYGSGSALAAAFGGTILEPSWWPADTEEISYSLDGRPGDAHFFIGSTRAGGGTRYASLVSLKLRGRDARPGIGWRVD